MEAEQAITQKAGELLDSVSSTVRQAVATANQGAGPDGELKATLSKLASDYANGTVKIYKRFPGQAEHSLFGQLEGYDLKQLAEEGPDSLCMREGGGGDYKVTVKIPGVDGLYKFNGIKVGGPSRNVPKSIEETQPDANTLGLPVGTPGQFGAPSLPLGFANARPSKELEKLVETVNAQNSQLASQANQSADRTVAMMTALMGMFLQHGQQGNNAAQVQAQARQDAEALAKVTALEAEIRRMREDREREEKQRAQERELLELKMQLQRVEAQASRPQQAGPEAWLIPLFSQMQNTSAAGQQAFQTLFLELLRNQSEKASMPEQLANFMSTQVATTQGLLSSMAEMAKAGLFGGNSDEHPVRDTILRIIDQAANVGGALLEAKAAQAPMPPQLPSVPPAPMPILTEAQQAVAPLGSLPAHPAETTETVVEDKEELQEPLTEDELDQANRDNAILRVVACCHSGIHVSEATCRLFAHASSGNRVAAKWLENPWPVTEQIFTFHGLPSEKAEALSQDIESFLEHLAGSGNPNDWCKTEYRPIREPKYARSGQADTDSVNPSPAVVTMSAEGTESPISAP